jgi:geranylgeranyl diphosphate synthase, type II
MNTIPDAALQHYLEEQRALVDAELERVIPSADQYPPSIHRAMRHAVFAGGKRLRPILCLETGRMLGADEQSLLRPATALELIHTYSLIHDDLPALDNDDLRRGRPTCHRAFGEATAILAGDALLTLSFEVLSSPGPPSAESKLRVIQEISHAIGTLKGMIGGHVIDLEAANQDVTAETLEYIHTAKTGALIRTAVRSGALYADAAPGDLERVTVYAEKVGLAFQIIDDLLDVLGTPEQLGKTVGKDNQQHKATYPALHGLDKSREMACRLLQEADKTLEPFGSRARWLREIAQYLKARNC